MLAAAEAASTSTGSNSVMTGKFSLSREKIISLAIEYGPKVFAAIVVLAAGMFVARSVGNIVQRGLGKREMEPPLRMLFVRFVKLLVLLLAILMAIQQLGFELLPLVAGLGVAGVGVGLAMQGVLSNLVAGLTIIFVKKFRVGEYIELNGVNGMVDTIELFSTTLVHPDLSRVIVPNRKIVGEIIHNYGKIRQLDLSIGVAYGTDLTKALGLIQELLARNPRVLKDPKPLVLTHSFADSAVNIAVKPWTALADFGPAKAEVNKAILEEFRNAGIQIPFPQREIRVLPGSEMTRVA
jgi:small conductance mechanosensitive channel